MDRETHCPQWDFLKSSTVSWTTGLCLARSSDEARGRRRGEDQIDLRATSNCVGRCAVRQATPLARRRGAVAELPRVSINTVGDLLGDGITGRSS
jgi:hypothetical protein